jgi:hypothetical protein
MSFFWGRFDPIEGEVDSEVQNLYRIRDNDGKEPLAKFVDLKQFGYDSEDNYKVNYTRRFYIIPNDSIWLNMTENERIENGLPSRFKLLYASLPGLVANACLTGI